MRVSASLLHIVLVVVSSRRSDGFRRQNAPSFGKDVLDSVAPTDAEFASYCKANGGVGAEIKTQGARSRCFCGKDGDGFDMVCMKGGKIGCDRKRRGLTRFSPADDAAVCVPNPCLSKGGWPVQGPSDGEDKSWLCESANSAPSNITVLFKEQCQINKGQLVGNTCKCNFGTDGLCQGTDGKINGKGCQGMHDFSETGCTDALPLVCPTCRPEPCGPSATLVPIGDMLEHRDNGFACSCQKGKTESSLCFNKDNQPGCRDHIIQDVRWAHFFVPWKCPNCKCAVAESYETSPWAANYKKKDNRFIYPVEDMCAKRGATLLMEASEDAGEAVCGCADPATMCLGSDKFFNGKGCSTETSFLANAPVASRGCQCKKVKCGAPGRPHDHPGPVKIVGAPKPGAEIEAPQFVGSDYEGFYLGDKVQWHCEPGYFVVDNGVHTRNTYRETVCMFGNSGVFQKHPPVCGSLNELLRPAGRYDGTKVGKAEHDFPKGKGVVRQYSLVASGKGMTVQVFKRGKETLPRTVEQTPITMDCKPVPDYSGHPQEIPFGDKEAWSKGMTCYAAFHYKHKKGTFSLWAKDPTKVLLRLIAAQDPNAHSQLMIAARETWVTSKGREEAGPWMQVVSAHR